MYVFLIVTNPLRARYDAQFYVYTYETDKAKICGFVQAAVNTVICLLALYNSLERLKGHWLPRWVMMTTEPKPFLISNQINFLAWLTLCAMDCAIAYESDNELMWLQLAIDCPGFLALWLLWHRADIDHSNIKSAFIAAVLHFTLLVMVIAFVAFGVQQADGHPNPLAYTQGVVQQILLFQLLHIAAMRIWPEQGNGLFTHEG